MKMTAADHAAVNVKLHLTSPTDITNKTRTQHASDSTCINIPAARRSHSVMVYGVPHLCFSSMRTLTPKPELGARCFTDRAVKTDISPNSCMKRPFVKWPAIQSRSLLSARRAPVIIIGRWHDSSASPIRLTPTFPPPVFARASQSTPWTLTKAMFFFHVLKLDSLSCVPIGQKTDSSLDGLTFWDGDVYIVSSSLPPMRR
ncbi:hypothetical protein CFIO01_07300 [Colletotrichum fioriniae PJ7]|uniref:Uncharacterized protein n=1 Tax=Colletotrichum fioriniae PJ7 TaxID=1445577 RepID=A0A010S4U0_9PEZI|nr:hypothetical protein CFIO01_07300 [Colletotrichum fioriniae PJ7]